MARRASAVGGPSPAMPKPPAPKSAAPRSKGLPTQAKAKAILSDGTVRGNPLTAPQKGLFGAIAGGTPPTGMAVAKPKARPAPMAIGQRPMLGTRTKTAMRKGRV